MWSKIRNAGPFRRRAAPLVMASERESRLGSYRRWLEGDEIEALVAIYRDSPQQHPAYAS